MDQWEGEIPGFDRRVEGIAVRLQSLGRYLDRSRDAVLAKYEMQWWEFKTLHLLRRNGPPYQATPGELAKHLAMSPAALTNRVDALERRGYVERHHDRDDRRKILARLTPAGLDIWQRGIGDIQAVEQSLVRALPAPDQDQLEALLRTLLQSTDPETA